MQGVGSILGLQGDCKHCFGVKLVQCMSRVQVSSSFLHEEKGLALTPRPMLLCALDSLQLLQAQINKQTFTERSEPLSTNIPLCWQERMQVS